MAHKQAKTWRAAYHRMTKNPNLPMARVEKSLARDGARIRKIAIGARKPYRSMNRLIIESTRSTSGCEKEATPTPAMRQPTTRTIRYFSNKLKMLASKFLSLVSFKPGDNTLCRTVLAGCVDASGVWLCPCVLSEFIDSTTSPLSPRGEYPG